jgi:hypothetical protein
VPQSLAAATRQRDLAISHQRIGDLAAATGDMAAARDAYTVALAIAARLATADPANTELAARAEALRQRITQVTQPQPIVSPIDAADS